MTLVTSLITGAIALGCGGYISARRGARRAAAAERRYPPLGQIIDVRGTPVHAVTMGDGPPLVLIHGASGNLRDFTLSLAPRMAAEGFRVIAFDRPGLGFTGRMDARHARLWGTRAETITDQAALLSTAARQLGADKPLLVGHSYGGAVALAWALNHTAAGLVSLSGVSMPWDGHLALYYRVLGSAPGGLIGPPVIAAWATRRQLDDSIVNVFAPDPPVPGYDAHFGIGLTIRSACLRANARQVNTLRAQMQALAPRYGDLALPTAFLHGDADTIVPLSIHARLAHPLIRDSTLVVLPGTGHMPHHVAPDAVAATIHSVAARAGLR